VTASTGESNPFQYAGRENDGTGVYYNRRRYYVPEWGRFLSEDPLGLEGGLNRYVYANNDPINWTDPDGLGPLPPGYDPNTWVNLGKDTYRNPPGSTPQEKWWWDTTEQGHGPHWDVDKSYPDYSEQWRYFPDTGQWEEKYGSKLNRQNREEQERRRQEKKDKKNKDRRLFLPAHEPALQPALPIPWWIGIFAAPGGIGAGGGGGGATLFPLNSPGFPVYTY
jgi:RHS repeat-associated protein